LKYSIAIYPKELEKLRIRHEAPQNFRLERVTIVRAHGTSEGESFEEKPTPSKTNFSSFLGIAREVLSKMKLPKNGGFFNE